MDDGHGQQVPLVTRVSLILTSGVPVFVVFVLLMGRRGLLVLMRS